MLKKILLLLCCVSSMAMAKTPVNVVEIANFYCPECYQAYQYSSNIKDAIKQSNGQLDFVPIFFGKVSPWPAKIYLSVPEKYQAQAQKALFSAAILNGLPMKTAESACVEVNDLAPHYSVDQCVDKANSSIVASRLSKALMLLHKVYGDTKTPLLFPIFIVEQGGKIKTVLSRNEYGNVKLLVNEVVKHVKAL